MNIQDCVHKDSVAIAKAVLTATAKTHFHWFADGSRLETSIYFHTEGTAQVEILVKFKSLLQEVKNESNNLA